jgi:hypothetical protein
VSKRTTSLSSEQVKNSVGTTNWNKLKARTDAEIEAAAASDPDARTFAPQELREFRRVNGGTAGKVSK